MERCACVQPLALHAWHGSLAVGIISCVACLGMTTYTYASQLWTTPIPRHQHTKPCTQVLAPGAAAININDRVMDLYLHHILPNITQPGDDSNYGSSVTHDVWALQALSKRIHFGKFVAEAKFLAERDTYSALIRAGDAEGIMDRITDAAVELKVCRVGGGVREMCLKRCWGRQTDLGPA